MSSSEAKELGFFFLIVGDFVAVGNGPDVVLGVRRRVSDASTSGEASTLGFLEVLTNRDDSWFRKKLLISLVSETMA